jgi:hypothetical protein
MLWEVEIEHFKRKHPAKDFSIPFTVGTEILKKIEDAFSIIYDKRYPLANWQKRVSGLQEMQTIDSNKVFQSYANYWIVIEDLRPNGHNLVYDCKGTLILSFAEMLGGDYYIVDKKYSWLIYYDSETECYFKKEQY